MITLMPNRRKAGLWTVSSIAGAGVLAVLAGSIAVASQSCGSSSDSTFQQPPADDSGGGGDSALVCTGANVACGAMCVDITSDPQNCGVCGTKCGATGVCCSSTCLLDTASCAFSVRDLKPRQGNQSGGDYVTITGDGFVAGMKVFIGDGAAPTLVKDAHTALIQTPPGPVGPKDIRIVNGTSKSTLPGAFTYVQAGLQLPWQEKPMAVVRGEDPGLGVLQDGRVLIVGGTTVPDSAANATDTAEIYTRTTDSVKSSAGTMAVKRWHSSVVTLLTGKVLIVGAAGASAVAEIYDPATDMFTPTAMPMNTARDYTRAVLMTDGRVLIASEGQKTAEIYDPASNAFTQIPTSQMHTFGFVVRLRDGRVMLGGGDMSQTSVEIYDPMSGQFSDGPPLAQGRSMLTAHTLPDGRVAVVGGSSISAGGVDVPLSTNEYYDPVMNKWTTAPYTLHPQNDAGAGVGRTWHASALVRDGTIIVMGGYTIDKSCAPSDSVEQVDPIAGTVKSFGTLPRPNCEWTAVTLQDGSVLGVGGGACGASTANPSLDFLPGVPISK